MGGVNRTNCAYPPFPLAYWKPWGGGGGGGGGGGIFGPVYRPDGLPSHPNPPGIFNTWSEIQAAIALTVGDVQLYVDDSIVTPAPVPAASGVTALGGRVTIQPFGTRPSTTLNVEAGATLQDLKRVTGSITVTLNPTALVPSLSLSTSQGVLEVDSFAEILNLAREPALVLPGAGDFFVLKLNNGATIDVSAGGSFVDMLLAGATVFGFFAVAGRVFTNPSFGWLIGPVGSFFGFDFDDSSTGGVTGGFGAFNVNPLFLGSIVQQQNIDLMNATLTFQPGGVASPGVFTNFAATGGNDSLYEAFLLTKGLVTICVDDTFQRPALGPPGTFDWQHRVKWVSANPSKGAVFQNDAAGIHQNIAELGGALQWQTSGAGPDGQLAFTAASFVPRFRICEKATLTILTAGGTGVAIVVGANQTLSIELDDAIVDNSIGPGFLANLTANTSVLNLQSTNLVAGDGFLAPIPFEGIAGSTLNLTYDDTWVGITLSSPPFAGNVQITPLGAALGSGQGPVHFTFPGDANAVLDATQSQFNSIIIDNGGLVVTTRTLTMTGRLPGLGNLMLVRNNNNAAAVTFKRVAGDAGVTLPANSAALIGGNGINSVLMGAMT